MYAPPRTSRSRRLGSFLMALGVIALAAGSLYGTVTVVRAAFGPAFAGAATPTQPTAARPSPAASGSIVVSPSAGPGASAATPSSGPSRAPSGSPAATQKAGPFRIDLYRGGAFISELTAVWCLPAAMQTSANIMDIHAGRKSDRTRARQKALFDLARSLAPSRDGAAEPEGWAAGLTRLGYGKYKVTALPSIQAAIQVAAQALRATGRPVGLMVWRGVHSWVMSGFTATADPAVTSRFAVTAVSIEDVWYPRISSIWGRSRPPDSLVPVKALPKDFLPWRLPWAHYPGKDGRFVIVVPVP